MTTCASCKKASSDCSPRSDARALHDVCCWLTCDPTTQAGRVDDLEAAALAAQHQTQQAQARAKQLEADVSKLSSQNASLRAETSTFASRQRRWERVQSELDAANASNVKLREELQGLRLSDNESSAQRQRLLEAESQATALQGQLGVLQRKVRVDTCGCAELCLTRDARNSGRHSATVQGQGTHTGEGDRAAS